MTREEIACNVLDDFFAELEKAKTRENDLTLIRAGAEFDWPYPKECFLYVGFDKYGGEFRPCVWAGCNWKRGMFTIPFRYAERVEVGEMEEIIEAELADLERELTQRHLYGADLKAKQKRKSRAKYRKGDPITSLDELNAQECVYCFDKIQQRGWFRSWQISLADHYIKRGALFKAVRKEKTDVPRREKDQSVGDRA